MTLNEDQQKIVDDSHAEWERREIRDERKEVYLAVAGALIRSYPATIDIGDFIEKKAEAIYQGMIRFCDENKKTGEV